jgi:Amidase
MDKYRLDALIAPTGNPAWTTDLVNGDHFGGSTSTPAAVAGYPSVTVPAGSAFGLPVGISFIGRAWRDDLVLTLATPTSRRRSIDARQRLPRGRLYTVNGRVDRAAVLKAETVTGGQGVQEKADFCSS